MSLYRLHRDWVISVALSFMGDFNAALDLAQETFCYLRGGPPGRFSGYDRYPRGFVLRSRFRTYLYPIIRRQCRIAQLSSRARPDKTSAASSVVAHDGGLTTVMETLPSPQREALLLHYVDLFELREITRALYLSERAVKLHLVKAIVLLKTDSHTARYFQSPGAGGDDSQLSKQIFPESLRIDLTRLYRYIHPVPEGFDNRVMAAATTRAVPRQRRAATGRWLTILCLLILLFMLIHAQYRNSSPSRDEPRSASRP